MIDTAVVAWIASSAAGVLAAAAGVVEGAYDINALGTLRNGRRIIAIGYLRSQTIRLLISIGWLAIGLPFAFDGRDTPWNWFTVTLVGTNALLAVAAWLDLIDRRRLRKGTHDG